MFQSKFPARKAKMSKLNKTVKGSGPSPVRLAGGAGAVADRTSSLIELLVASPQKPVFEHGLEWWVSL